VIGNWDHRWLAAQAVRHDGDAVGCVWELEVLLHERAAWTDHVLNSEADDYRAYLQDVFSPGHGHGSTPDTTTGGVTSST